MVGLFGQELRVDDGGGHFRERLFLVFRDAGHTAAGASTIPKWNGRNAWIRLMRSMGRGTLRAWLWPTGGRQRPLVGTV